MEVLDSAPAPTRVRAGSLPARGIAGILRTVSGWHDRGFFVQRSRGIDLTGCFEKDAILQRPAAFPCTRLLLS